jgi:MtN3 and saliva related transmembrane protein
VSAAALVGTVAAICSVTAFLPQALRIIKTRKTEDLSTTMWILQVTGFTLWIGYGVVLGEWPIIIPNTICALLSAFILSMKLLPSTKRDRVADAVEHALPDVVTSGRSS